MVKKVKSTDKIALELTLYERKLIISETFTDDNLLKQVRLAQVKGKNIVSMFTLSELDDLAGHLAFAANHAESPKTQKKLDRIIDKINSLLEKYYDEDEHLPLDTPVSPANKVFNDIIHGDNFCSNPTNEFQNFIKEAIKGKTFKSLDDLNNFLATQNKAYNDIPKKDMGSLSPAQVAALLDSDWDSEKSSIQLNSGLSFDYLKEVPILGNSRIFLDTLLRAGGIKATAKGNLNRKFVTEMLDQMKWPEKYVESVRDVNKVVNEMDVFLIHILRIILQQAGLMRKVKGAFQITKNGKIFLREDMAGELYILLFKTLFLKINLAYLDRMPEFSSFQDTIAFSIYMFGKLCANWEKPKDIASSLLLPSVREEIHMIYPYDMTAVLIKTRFINPLESFGLLERKYISGKTYYFAEYEIRKTELFDSFFKFDLGKKASTSHNLH